MKLYRNENTVALVTQQGNWMTAMSLCGSEDFYTYFEFELFNPSAELPSEEKFWQIFAEQEHNGWSDCGTIRELCDGLLIKTRILNQLVDAMK